MRRPSFADKMGLPSIVLASQSPRRRELLNRLGINFVARVPNVPETIEEGESPEGFVQRMAFEKAASVAAEFPQIPVLGSDTIVVIHDEILGKPSNEQEAASMLRQLSGNEHQVFTGFAFYQQATGAKVIGVSGAKVFFRQIQPREIDAYVSGGSPLDKAGAYGIQDDVGALFVDRIEGDYYSIVGLPVKGVYLALQEIQRQILESAK